MVKEYTTDWLTEFIPKWNEILDKFVPLNGLEVGTFEGRATVHLLSRYPELKMTVIDNFEDKYSGDYESRFDNNVLEFGNRVNKIVGDSTDELNKLLENVQSGAPGYTKFDFIYIDGDHSYEKTKEALEICWDLLKTDGILFLDDYNDHLRENTFKFGVDSAVNEFFIGRKDVFVLSNINTDYQFYCKKIVDRDAEDAFMYRNLK